MKWRTSEPEFGQIEAFIATDDEVDEARRSEALCLPDHMIPRRMVAPRELPENQNGKVDREALG